MGIFIFSSVAFPQALYPQYEQQLMGYFEGEYRLIYIPSFYNPYYSFVDLTGDGINDLAITGLNPKFYMNTNTNTEPEYEEISYVIPVDQDLNFIRYRDINFDQAPDALCIWHDFEWGVGNGLAMNIGTITDPLFDMQAYFFWEEYGNNIRSSDFININGDSLIDVIVSNILNINLGPIDEPLFEQDTLEIIPENLLLNALAVCDIDNDGDDDLFVVSEDDQHISLFRNDGTPQNYSFTLITGNYQDIETDFINNMMFYDMDFDGDFDLFTVGSTESPVYLNVGTPDSAIFIRLYDNYFGFPNNFSSKYPEMCDIDNDGDYDMLIYLLDGSPNMVITYVENIGNTQEPDWSCSEDTLISFTQGWWDLPFDFETCDIDADNDEDLFVIYRTGPHYYNYEIHYYENSGNPEEPIYEFVSEILMEYSAFSIELLDIDGDNDYDLFYSTSSGDEIYFYRNTGTPDSMNFVLDNLDLLNYQTPWVIPFFGDFDSDGDFDLLTRYENPVTGNDILYWRNDGNQYQWDYTLVPIFDFGLSEINGSMFNFEGEAVDINADGLTDIFIYNGILEHYICTGLSPNPVEEIGDIQIPSEFNLSQNYPNPFNPSTTIRFDLPDAGQVSLMVYNIKGQQVASLIDSYYQPGYHSIEWDAGDLPSGIYFARLKADGYIRTVKCLLVK